MENRKGISLPQIGHWAKISTWPSATVRSQPTWPGVGQPMRARPQRYSERARGCAVHTLSNRSGEAAGERTTAHIGQALLGECY
jgi:hypothetical protein